MKARILEDMVTIDKETYETVVYAPIAYIIKYQFANEQKVIEFINSSNITSMNLINILMDLAIKAEYHQVYLTLLKKKEQLNGFTQTNNFEF